MHRRSNTMSLVVAVVGCVALMYGYYTFTNINRKLSLKTDQIYQLNHQKEELKNQLKVVYTHTTKLEEALRNEKDKHRLAKQEMATKVSEFRMNLTRTKHETHNRFNALDTTYKMLKATHEEVQQNHAALQQQYVRLSDDHKRIAGEAKSDYDKLKDAKETESASLQNRIQELFNMKIYYQEQAQQVQQTYQDTSKKYEEINKLAKQYSERLEKYGEEVKFYKERLQKCRANSHSRLQETSLGFAKPIPGQNDTDVFELSNDDRFSKKEQVELASQSNGTTSDEFTVPHRYAELRSNDTTNTSFKPEEITGKTDVNEHKNTDNAAFKYVDEKEVDNQKIKFNPDNYDLSRERRVLGNKGEPTFSNMVNEEKQKEEEKPSVLQEKPVQHNVIKTPIVEEEKPVQSDREKTLQNAVDNNSTTITSYNNAEDEEDMRGHEEDELEDNTEEGHVESEDYRKPRESEDYQKPSESEDYQKPRNNEKPRDNESNPKEVKSLEIRQRREYAESVQRQKQMNAKTEITEDFLSRKKPRNDAVENFSPLGKSKHKEVKEHPSENKVIDELPMQNNAAQLDDSVAENRDNLIGKTRPMAKVGGRKKTLPTTYSPQVTEVTTTTMSPMRINNAPKVNNDNIRPLKKTQLTDDNNRDGGSHQLKPPRQLSDNEAENNIAGGNQLKAPVMRHEKDDNNGLQAAHDVVDINEKEKRPMIKPKLKRDQSDDQANEEASKEERMDVQGVTLEDDETGDQNLDEHNNNNNNNNNNIFRKNKQLIVPEVVNDNTVLNNHAPYENGIEE